MGEIIAAVVAVVVAFLIAWPFQATSCHTKGESFEDVEYHLVGGCMVKHKGKWLPIDNIRGFDDN